MDIFEESLQVGVGESLASPPSIGELLDVVLREKLAVSGKASLTITEDTDLLGLGIVDSLTLIDLILGVEAKVPTYRFAPELMPLEGGISIRTLSQAFAPQ